MLPETRVKARTFAWLAEALCYPYDKLQGYLQLEFRNLPKNQHSNLLEAFLSEIEKMALPEWEELYTRTWDLSPMVIPYVGYQVWGEAYQRGNFLVEMSKALSAAGIKTEGELADHLIPVLRYLSVELNPLPELVEIFPIAVNSMKQSLQEVDPSNPYLYLLEAISQVF